MHRFLCHILCLSLCCLLMVLTGCSDNDDFSFPKNSRTAPADTPSTTPPPETPPTSPPETPPTPLPETLALTSPARIAEFDAGHLLVSDYESNYIYIVDKTTLQPTAKIKVQGKSTGIAMADDKIFVGNRTLRSVDVFDLQGNLLYRLGSGKAQFLQINDVAVDTTRRVVYALDTKEKRIKRFNLDGTSAGTDIGVGILQQPTALTVDPATGNILVSDFGNTSTPIPPQIRFFTPSGTESFPILGSAAAFSRPQGLYVVNSHLFLPDTLSGEIQIYDLTTRLLVKILGSRGSDEAQLLYPLDVYVDSATQDIYVTDNRNVRVTVFRGGTLP